MAGAECFLDLFLLGEGEEATCGTDGFAADDNPAVVEGGAGKEEAGDEFRGDGGVNGRAAILNSAGTDLAFNSDEGSNFLFGEGFDCLGEGADEAFLGGKPVFFARADGLGEQALGGFRAGR